MLDGFLTLPALAGLTIVLGIDNVLAIAVVSRGVAPERRDLARRAGILLALAARLGLLLLLAWVLRIADVPLGLGPLTLRDGLLLAGGLFLIAKSAYELRDRTLRPAAGEAPEPRPVSLRRAVLQIVAIDMTLSLDSVVTVVGMAPNVEVMVAAILVEVGVILFFAGAVCRLLERYPSIETLAICALLMVGGVLVSEGAGLPLSKNTVYAMMLFALFVEVVNLRIEHVARDRRYTPLPRRSTPSSARPMVQR